MKARIVTIGGVTYGYVTNTTGLPWLDWEIAHRLEYGHWLPQWARTKHGTFAPEPNFRPDSETIALLDRAYIERMAEDA